MLILCSTKFIFVYKNIIFLLVYFVNAFKEIYFVKFDLLENKIVYLYNQEEQSRTKIDFYVKGVIHMLKKERQERIITLLEKDFLFN